MYLLCVRNFRKWIRCGKCTNVQNTFINYVLAVFNNWYNNWLRLFVNKNSYFIRYLMNKCIFIKIWFFNIQFYLIPMRNKPIILFEPRIIKSFHCTAIKNIYAIKKLEPNRDRRNNQLEHIINLTIVKDFFDYFI